MFELSSPYFTSYQKLLKNINNAQEETQSKLTAHQRHQPDKGTMSIKHIDRKQNNQLSLPQTRRPDC